MPAAQAPPKTRAHSLRDLARAVADLPARMTAAVDTARTELGTRLETMQGDLAEATRRMTVAEDQVARMRESLLRHRISLPGSETTSTGVRVGHFLARAAQLRAARGNVEASLSGMSDNAKRTWGQVDEISREARKGASTHTRLLVTENDTGLGLLVPEEISSEFIGQVYASTALDSVPARTVTGVSGVPYHVHRLTGSGTAQWIGEADTLTEGTDITVGQTSFRPRKLGTLQGMSLEQATAGTPSALSLVESDLREVLALKLDLAAIEGTGGEYQPLGLINWSGLAASFDATAAASGFPAAANGRDLTHQFMQRIKQKLELLNVPLEGHGYLMPTAMFHVLQLQEQGTGGTTATGSPLNMPIMLSAEQIRAIHGPIGYTTQYATNLTIGSSTDGGRIITGNWPMFWRLSWGGMVVRQSDTAVVGSHNAFTDDLLFIRTSSLHDSGPVRPSDFMITTGFRTTRSGV